MHDGQNDRRSPFQQIKYPEGKPANYSPVDFIVYTRITLRILLVQSNHALHFIQELSAQPLSMVFISMRSII